MSFVRVNLLPPEVTQRQVARRVAMGTVAGVAVYAGLLGAAYILKLGAVDAARDDRDTAQLEVDALRADLSALEQYAVLAQTLEARNQMLAAAMAQEVSWARVFNDLSLSFPPSASLLTIAANINEVTAPAAPAPAPAPTDPAATPDPSATASPTPTPEPDPGTVTATVGAPVASVLFTGYSVERYSPGVETVLLQLDDVRGFFNSYLTTAGELLRGETLVTSFDGAVELNDEVFTERYADGLPEEGPR